MRVFVRTLSGNFNLVKSFKEEKKRNFLFLWCNKSYRDAVMWCTVSSSFKQLRRNSKKCLYDSTLMSLFVWPVISSKNFLQKCEMICSILLSHHHHAEEIGLVQLQWIIFHRTASVELLKGFFYLVKKGPHRIAPHQSSWISSRAKCTKLQW